MKHTKGPWKAVNNGPHHNNPDITNFEIQFWEDGECVVDHVYEKADAHLIAAAPDMFDVLIDILHHEQDIDISTVASIKSVLKKASGELYTAQTKGGK